MEFNDVIFAFNYTQTKLLTIKDLDNQILEVLNNQELPEQYLEEVRLEFMEVYDSIKFVKNLSSIDRPRIKDLKRWDRPYAKDRKLDKEGRIEINLSNPHILEGMDYFRQAAIAFQTTGRYTHLYPNTNPHSEYSAFWKEEARRCREGLIRPSDGEWIPGYFYFYLNYSPILKVVKNAENISTRVDDFPNIYDGDYLFFHYLDKARKKGKHTATLKKRGAGFSFKGGSKLARNFILGETSESTKFQKSFAIANEKEYLIKDGVLNKFLDIINFCAEQTPFPRTREIKDSINDMHWEMGYKDPDTNKPKGVQNVAMGVTLKNDPHRARGKRGVLIEWEEVGSFTNFLTAWGVARPSVEEDGEVFGLMNAYGTGGEEGVDFAGLEEIFYSPKGYNILSIPNVFDKHTDENSKECAFFFPQYMNTNGFYDKDGNSDVIGAILRLLVSRINVKYNTQDPNAIVQEKAERPITPQEAIMRTEGSAFPVGALKQLLETIKPNYTQFVSEHFVGDLRYDKKGEIEFYPLADARPIRTFPLKNKSNAEGAIEIFEQPKKERIGEKDVIRPYRYIAGCDPVDNDYTKDGSLASIFIFDTWTDRIVAEYTGRPVLASEFYEKCIMLCKYYNATLNYENNLKGLFIHFSNQNCLHLLCDTPQYLRDQEMVTTILKGNRAKGTRTTNEVIKVGKTLQREWMLSRNTIVDGEGEEITYLNYERIRSLGYIEECIAWHGDGNFDRVSAMDMVMIYRQDILKMSIQSKEISPEDYFTPEGDDFIDKNWNKFLNNTEYRQPNSSF